MQSDVSYVKCRRKDGQGRFQGLAWVLIMTRIRAGSSWRRDKCFRIEFGWEHGPFSLRPLGTRRRSNVQKVIWRLPFASGSDSAIHIWSNSYPYSGLCDIPLSLLVIPIDFFRYLIRIHIPLILYNCNQNVRKGDVSYLFAIPRCQDQQNIDETSRIQAVD